MVLAVVLAVVLVVVGVTAFVRLRAVEAERDALETERARLAADGEALRARVAELRREADELIPYRDAVDAAEDWLWATDEEGTLRFSSPAGAALLGREDLVGTPLSELTHEQDQPVGWNGVLRRKHADGSHRTVDSRSVRSGRGWQGIDRDLTGGIPAKATPGVAVVRSPGRRRPPRGGRLRADRRRGRARRLHACRAARARRRAAGVGRAGRRRPAGAGPDAHGPAADAGRVDRARERAQGGRASRSRSTGSTAPPTLLEHCGIVKVGVSGRADDELRALLAEPAERGLELVATGVATGGRVHALPGARLLALPGRVLRPPDAASAAAAARSRSLQALGELTSTRAPPSSSSSGSSAPTSASRSACCATSTRRSSRSRARSTPCARR